MYKSMNTTFPESEITFENLFNEAKLVFSKCDIEWTKCIMLKCQDFIQSHKESLNNYLDERIVLMEEKSSLKDVNNGHDVRIFPSGPNTVSCNGLQNISNKSKLFDDSYEILKTVKSESFYSSIAERLGRSPHFKLIHFQNQTFIPNELKLNSKDRKMLLFRIDMTGEYKISDIISEPVTTAVDIHVSDGVGELMSVRGEEPSLEYKMTQISPKTSYQIMESQTILTRFVILVTVVPMMLALEVYCAEDPLGSIEELRVLQGFQENSNVTYPSSFISRSLSANEIRDRLLFIDASFAIDVNDSLVPIEIILLNYKGIAVLNTTICPRNRIKKYCDEWHGVTESDVLGKADSVAITKEFNNIIRDKVLVGHNLAFKMKTLKIDMRSICGARELQGCYALRRIMPPGTTSWSLNTISEMILKQSVPNVKHLAQKNGHAIRNIYIAIEEFWQDSGSERVVDTDFGSATRDQCGVNDFFGSNRRQY